MKQTQQERESNRAKSNTLIFFVLLIAANMYSCYGAAQDGNSITYTVTKVTYSEREFEGDEWGDYIVADLNKLVSKDIVYNQKVNGFLLPTINSGVLPVVVGKLITESTMEGATVSVFESKYRYNDETLDCEIVAFDRDNYNSVIFFKVEGLVIVYEMRYTEQSSTEGLGRVY